jgi:glycosyltransferase involved in cell wall biosynthesis
MTPPRIAILHQGCVPTYRRAFFERLAHVPERQYVVFHGAPEPGSGIAAAAQPYRFNNNPVTNRFWRLFGRTLVYQPVFSHIARSGFDAIVIGHETKYLANIALAVWFRLIGKPVLLWGFGQHIDTFRDFRSPVGRVVSWAVRQAQSVMLRLATDFMAYTEKGAALAGMAKQRTTVLNNTIDLSQEIVAHSQAQTLDRSVLRRRYGLARESIVFLFVGRLNNAKRVDALIQAAKALRKSQALPVEVVIVGGGPKEEALKKLAEGAAWCHFLGAIHDVGILSQLFRVSDAVVIPGYVGLAVNHAFAHGLPVITCHSATHSPEIEYIRDGVNGVILPCMAALGEGLREFALSETMREMLAAGALASRDALDLQKMVNAFDGGVRRALERHRRGYEDNRLAEPS